MEIVQPGIAGNLISATFHNDYAALYLSKKTNSVTVGMGPHLTAILFRQLKRLKLDYIICNGENTLFELIQNLKSQMNQN